jgi:cytochrome c oxidase subunit 2
VRLVLGCLVAACSPPAAPINATAPPAVVRLDGAPGGALDIYVLVSRWTCAISYRDDVHSDELRVPVGRPVRILFATSDASSGLDAAIDGTTVHVEFRRFHPLALRFDRAGSYAWQCPVQQPPGGRHDEAPIVAMPAAEFEAYVARLSDAQAPSTTEDKIAFGKVLYDRKGCSSCHTVDGSPRVGPSWLGIWGTQVKLADGTTRVVDAEYVKASILTPGAFARPGFPNTMPAFQGHLRPVEIESLVAYIQSLVR